MYSRAYAVALALLAFSAFAFASPLAETPATALVKRHNGADSLDCILQAILELQVKIFIVIEQIKLLGGKGDCSSLIGQIIVLVNACLAIVAEIGIATDLSDKVKIQVIAKAVADIIVAIQAHIGVFAKVSANVAAFAQLDLCLKALLVQLNVSIAGFVHVLTPLLAGLNVHVNLVLSVALRVVGLL